MMDEQIQHPGEPDAPRKALIEAARRYLSGDDARTFHTVAAQTEPDENARIPGDLADEVEMQEFIDDSMLRLFTPLGLDDLSAVISRRVRERTAGAGKRERPSEAAAAAVVLRASDAGVDTPTVSASSVAPAASSGEAAAPGSASRRDITEIHTRGNPAAQDRSVTAPARGWQLIRDRITARRLALAAVFLAGCLGLFRMGMYAYEAWTPAYVPPDTAFDHDVRFSYVRLLQSEFQPVHLLPDPQAGAALAAAINDRFRTSINLDMRGISSDIHLVGYGDSNVLSDHTMTVLAQVNNAPVILFIDTANNNYPQQDVCHYPVQRFERDMGGLVIYEVTPYARASLLNRFVSADSQ